MADRYGVQYTKTLDATRDMIEPSEWKGRIRVCADQYDLVAAVVGINDRLFVGKIPSHAKLLPDSLIYHTALGAGAADVDFGDVQDPDGLADGLDMTNAGSKNAMNVVTVANYGKKLWELLGYAADPKRELSLFITFKAEPAANGQLATVLKYVVD